jgi:multidrug resistance efflux pump
MTTADTVERGVFSWRALVLAVLCLAVATVAAGFWAAKKFMPPASTTNTLITEFDDDDPDFTKAPPLPIKVVHPKRDPNFTIRVPVPAYVEAYYQADLLARVAGPVLSVSKDLGDLVQKGELLAEIDVPDLAAAVADKEAIIRQRASDVDLAIAKANSAAAAVAVGREMVGQRQAEVRQAMAMRDYREKEMRRFSSLVNDKAVTRDVLEESERSFQASEAGYEGAQASVGKAKADVQEMEANSRAAFVDIEVKRNLLRVAEKDRDLALTMMDLAKLRAPFDGVIVGRKVDVGRFVQNASTGSTTPVLTVARLDMVTVYAKLPDDFADLLRDQTIASIRMEKRPGLEVRGKVTRYAPFIESRDRTLRVEVDLYNAPYPSYQKALSKTLAMFLNALNAQSNLGAASCLAPAFNWWHAHTKGANEAFPAFPGVRGTALQSGPYRLLPGMYGQMVLNLQNYRNAYLLPSSTVFNYGGKRFVMLVRAGVAHRVPVHVQVDDGNVVMLVLAGPSKADKTGEGSEISQALTGDEEFALHGQSEVHDDQPVRPTLVDW